MSWDDEELRTQVLEEFEEVNEPRIEAFYEDFSASVIKRKGLVLLSEEERRRRHCERVKRWKREREGKTSVSAVTRAILRGSYTARRIERMQEKMPKDRSGVTHHFVIIARVFDETGRVVEGKLKEIDGYLTANCYDDGRLGEVFIRIGKEGEDSAVLSMWAVAFSVAIQYGVPLDALCSKFINTKFEPSGATKNKDIPRCTSPVDYVVKFLLLRFGKKDEASAPTPAQAPEVTR